MAPAELEGVVTSHPSVADCGVIGVLHDEAGELPKAFVVLKNGHEISEQEIQDYVKGQYLLREFSDITDTHISNFEYICQIF